MSFSFKFASDRDEFRLRDGRRVPEKAASGMLTFVLLLALVAALCAVAIGLDRKRQARTRADAAAQLAYALQGALAEAREAPDKVVAARVEARMRAAMAGRVEVGEVSVATREGARMARANIGLSPNLEEQWRGLRTRYGVVEARVD